ncbi:glycoside hydrolase family 30 protein [Chondrinema litorale]|uniref:glycoside hydrolase family 30 protein n=1 Tax=Chondrinema litorale TaxID=2994555 RepID=UPI002543CD7E|nr:glycoside hydrolase family 30 beta sandwich domain-containing protein [Chondrinema litorale]UZR97625.1 glucosylceramidase [Chondrinema litorale]
MVLSALWSCSTIVKEEKVGENNNVKNEIWLTTSDRSVLFQKQSSPLKSSKVKGENIISISPEKEFQTMDGFGFTLTGGSALHIHNMEADARMTLLTELFATDKKNIGISYLRVSIGASDLDAVPFSYNDLEKGETDESLSKFSIEEDQKHLIPVLKEILKIAPDIKILGSPWSPPTWMKTNEDTRGGSLKPEYYDAYARYFVKYIEAMQAENIRIDAITIQNEPLHPGNNPSLLMLPEQQAEFIKNHLGPTFEKTGIKTKIILYDHNADRPDYPITILDDPEAKKFVDGSAFHLYAGEIDALSQVHEAHPDKHLYFTEQWIGAPGDFPVDLDWHTKTLIVGASRNWCKTVLEWNLANDPNMEPHTDRGGCDRCLGAVTIDGNEVTRNPAYYIIAHASKFVRPGSKRIDSNLPKDLPNVAFKTPEGNVVLIVFNDAEKKLDYQIELEGELFEASQAASSVATYILNNQKS